MHGTISKPEEDGMILHQDSPPPIWVKNGTQTSKRTHRGVQQQVIATGHGKPLEARSHSIATETPTWQIGG